MSISTLEIKENWDIVNKKAKLAAEKCGRDINGIKILAVSKTHPVDYVYKAIEAGINTFGENYAKEVKDKYLDLDKNNIKQPEWHYIGGLQRSNVKHIAFFADMIHSVDSLKLAKEIDKRAKENNRIIPCLLEVNTSDETTKSGCEPEELIALAKEVLILKNIDLQGLMSIGSFTNDEKISRKEFTILRNLLAELNKDTGKKLKELSMGMTNDFHIAIEEGATIVRVGTAVFGRRTYKS